jgi:hypothetical protein
MGIHGVVSLTAAVPFAIWGALKFTNMGPFSEEVKPAEEENFALFTHGNNELHCLDRELRHPCVSELREYVDDKNSTEKRQGALDCIRGVLSTTDDFYVLKNMTHLLLDLDTVVHVFDKESRDNDFVMAGIDYAKKLMKNPDCLAEYDTKYDLECRCVPLYTKISLLKYKNAGLIDEAKAMFDETKALTYESDKKTLAAGEAVRWLHWDQTPQIWVPGLRSQPIWPRETWGDLPICKRLEDNFETIKEETQRALNNDPADSGFEDAYRFLYEKGEWSQILLYNGREFTRECEGVMPKTCALLKQWLPSKPGLPYTSDQNEQVLVLKMKKGTNVELHSGPANNILNIHIGISGLEGARLTVAGEDYKWEEGKVIAWDGSYDHKIDCLECVDDQRVIMMVRYMHPDMTPEHYKGIAKTQFEAVPEHLQ